MGRDALLCSPPHILICCGQFIHGVISCLWLPVEDGLLLCISGHPVLHLHVLCQVWLTCVCVCVCVCVCCVRYGSRSCLWSGWCVCVREAGMLIMFSPRLQWKCRTPARESSHSYPTSPCQCQLNRCHHPTHTHTHTHTHTQTPEYIAERSAE